MAFIIRPIEKNISSVHKELASALASKGFFRSQGVMADRYYKKGDPGSQTFFVYGRSFSDGGSQNSKSSFNICVLDTGNRLRVFFSDPSEAPEASQFNYNRFLHFHSFSSGRAEKFIAEVVDDAAATSLLKPETAYRVFIHNHLAELSGMALNASGRMYDDGCSGGAAFLYNIILNHGDFAALTSHNNFLFLPWKAFSDQAARYGVGIIPGFEATLPIFQHEPWLIGKPQGKSHNPNGPHIVLLFDKPETAKEFWDRNFSGRGQYGYAPSASSYVELARVYYLIEKRYSGSIARLMAHPACDVALPDVGLVHRAAKGEITLEQMENLILRSQAIACFNMTLDGKPLDFALYRSQVQDCKDFDAAEKERRLKNIADAQAYFTALLRRHNLGPAFAPNNINAALAREFEGKVFSYSDTDSHNFDWGYTDAGPFMWMIGSMGMLSFGHNTLQLPSLPGKRILPEDVVRFLIDPKSIAGASWGAKLYSELQNGNLAIAKGRQDSTWTQDAFNFLEEMYYKIFKQVPNLAKDTSGQATLHEPLLLLRGSIPGVIPK